MRKPEKHQTTRGKGTLAMQHKLSGKRETNLHLIQRDLSKKSKRPDQDLAGATDQGAHEQAG